MKTSRLRTEAELYPDYSDAIDIIEEVGISDELLHKIIQRHKPNALYNRSLYKRYEMLQFEVPILNREPRFKTETGTPINNKLANDFFGEIVDFATGYFCR